MRTLRFNTNALNRLRYSLWAPIYDGLAAFLAAKRRRSVAVAAVQPGERLLILGAGTGLDLEWLPRGAAVTAIDLTPAMLARLRRRADRLGFPVEARIMDGQALEFPESSFDVVLLHLILAVIPDPVRCLGEVARVLGPGGRAVVFDKFIPDEGRVPLAVRCLAPVISFFGTEIDRRLGPILAPSGLTIAHRENAGFRGLYQIVRLEKPVG